MSKPVIYLNGEILPLSKARLSPFDRGFLFGDGLFETLRLYRGRPFALTQHLERLSAGAAALKFPFKTDQIYGPLILEILVEQNGLAEVDSYLRITVTRGSDDGALLPGEELTPTVMMVNKPLAGAVTAARTEGMKACLLQGGREGGGGLSHLKSLNFLPSVLGKMAAHEGGVQEGLFTGPEGELLEGTGSNLFVIKGERLTTPPLTSGILPGVTRQVALNLAGELGLEVREEGVTREALYSSDEAFLTNSIIEIAPLIEVEGRPVGNGRAGEKTGRLRKAYKKRVRREITEIE